MKALVHTPTHLVFKHVPVGLAFIMGLLILLGVGAGAAAITSHQTLVWTDDFIRLGVGLILGTLVLGGLITWKAVRTRRLIFDADADIVRLESRGLGPLQLTSWPLAKLVRAEVLSSYTTGSGPTHATKLVFIDGQSKTLGIMDPPTQGQVAHNVATINGWLAARLERGPGQSPRA